MAVQQPVKSNWTNPPAPVAVFFAALAAKLFYIWKFAPKLLCLDQWDGVISRTLIPLVNHTLDPFDLIAPYNDHRMLFQRLQDITLFRLFGHYDNRTWCCFNAIFHSAILATFCWMLIKSADGNGRWWIAASCTAIGVLPFASENTLCGFQSQVYWLLLFTLAAAWFWSTADESRSGIRFNLGWFFGLCAVFTLASGFAIALAALPWFIKQGRRFMLLTIIVAFGAWLKFGFTSYQAFPSAELAAHARGPADFGLSAFRCLSWPSVFSPWMILIALLPAFLALRQKLHPFLAVIFAWVIIQSLAISLARGENGRIPLPRLQEYLALLLPLSTAVWVSLPGKFTAWRGAWLATAANGLILLTLYDFAVDLPGRVQMESMWDRNTRALYPMNNPAPFAGQPSWALPWPKGAADFNALIHLAVFARVIDGKSLRP